MGPDHHRLDLHGLCEISWNPAGSRRGSAIKETVAFSFDLCHNIGILKDSGGSGVANYANTSLYTPQEIALWTRLEALAGTELVTAKGLHFRFTLRGNELFVDRKEKSITRSTVNQAYRKAVELSGAVPGPKTLGTFGASYLYPIFQRLGIIDGGLFSSGKGADDHCGD